MSAESKMRYTLSALAWVGVLLCSWGLFSSAQSVAATEGDIAIHAEAAPR